MQLISSLGLNGFGNAYNYGARTVLGTPAGLFVGTANPFGPEVALRSANRWVYVPNEDGGGYGGFHCFSLTP